MVADISRAPLEFCREKLGIIFHYSKQNRYSFHALIGAFEINLNLIDIPIFLSSREMFFQDLDRLFSVDGFNKLIVGFSINSFQINYFKKLIENLNSHPRRDDFIIIVGGPHPSALPKNLLDIGADIVVIGEGEKSFPELITLIRNNEQLSQQKGIAFKTNAQKFCLQPKNDLVDLNNYPPFAPKRGLYSAIEITRGCKFGCKYCQVPSLFGKTIRYRNPDNVIKWGEYLLSKRPHWDFRFISTNAFGYYSKRSDNPNVKKIQELLSGLKKLKAKKSKRIFFGTFPSEVRPESITDDTLNLTKEFCDNTNLTMGAQSGSQKILGIIKRGHSVEQIHNAVDLALKYGFQLNIDFILGFPEETPEDQYATLELCKELIAKKCKIHMHYLIPLPGTAYENKIPRELDPEVFTILGRWSKKGLIFGSWDHQYNTVKNRLKIRK